MISVTFMKTSWATVFSLSIIGFSFSVAGQDVTEDFTWDLDYNISGTVEAYSSYFPNNDRAAKGQENDTWEQWSHLSLTGELFPTDSLTVTAKIDAIASTYRDAEQGVFPKPNISSDQPRYLDLNTLFVTYTGDDFDLTAGKAPLKVGVAELGSITDLYGTGNGANLRHGISAGVWQTTADIFIDDDILSVSWLPLEEASRRPPEGSRWADRTGLEKAGFNDLSPIEIKTKTRSGKPEHWSGLLKYSGFRSSLDYFVTAYWGLSPYQVLRTTNVTAPLPGETIYQERLRPKAFIASAGATTTWESWKFYGETLYQETADGRDDDFFRYLIGVRHNDDRIAPFLGADELSMTAEWSHEIITSGAGNDPRLSASSRSLRLQPRSLAFGIEAKYGDDLKLQIGSDYNFRDHDYSTGGGLVYDWNDNLSLSLTGFVFEGREDTHFGKYNHADLIEVGFEYKF